MNISPEAKQAASAWWKLEIKDKTRLIDFETMYAEGYDSRNEEVAKLRTDYELLSDDFRAIADSNAKLREELAKAWESNGELLLKLAHQQPSAPTQERKEGEEICTKNENLTTTAHAVGDEDKPPTPDVEQLGRLVREVWISWAKEQPNPKPSWLVPWEGLSEPDKEVDRRIGAAVAAQARAPLVEAAVGLLAELTNGQNVPSLSALEKLRQALTGKGEKFQTNNKTKGNNEQ